MGDLLSMVSAFLMLVLILLAAWALSRFLGKHWNGFRRAKYMSIVDQLVVGQDRLLLIVKMDREDTCYLFSSSQEGVQLLLRLSGDYGDGFLGNMNGHGIGSDSEEVLEADNNFMDNSFRQRFQKALSSLRDGKKGRDDVRKQENQ